MICEDRIWDELDAIEEALGGDVRRLERALRRQDASTLRRAYVRAVLAHAEGIAGWVKRYTILLYHPGMLGDKEKTTLLRRDGALLGMFNAFDLFTDAAGARTPFKKGSREWACLHAAIAIRNRITHVACQRDVVISDVDLLRVREVHAIVMKLTATGLSRSALALFRKAKAIRRRGAEIRAQTMTS